MINSKKLKLFLLSLTVFSAICIFVASFQIWNFSNKNQLVKTDAAIVLGAAVWGDQPSPVLAERINHAIWLYENGYVNNIIFTGGKSKEDMYAEAEVARNYAITNKVDPEAIKIETKSTITEENLTHANKVANEENLKSFTIVSDPLHMKRAMTMAQHTGLKAYSSPTQTSVYATWKSKIPFFVRELFFYIGYMISLPFR
ncbi:YdcF family protein [Aquibacillus sediminis]|uniref:YdcF family protein n=1 Tax=Aquibacillus sediminis TaxID=2574734 RepID=UPI001108CA32|nr:YdcF family protein [Aquibacillus sediminis]